MSWIDGLPASERAALNDAGRLGNSRFVGPENTVTEPSTDQFLVNVERAAYLMGGIDPDTVRHMVNSGQIPHIRLGRRILVSVEGLRAWIAANDGREVFA